VAPILTELASKADVFIENFRPASLKALGLSYESLSERNPRLIHCAISATDARRLLQIARL